MAKLVSLTQNKRGAVRKGKRLILVLAKDTLCAQTESAINAVTHKQLSGCQVSKPIQGNAGSRVVRMVPKKGCGFIDHIIRSVESPLISTDDSR